MSRRFFFSPRISGIGFVLVISMICLSRWQWNRHLEKKEIIQNLEHRLEMPVLPSTDALTEVLSEPDSYFHRKIMIRGEYDFKHEVMIRNRRREDTPGMILLTPVKLEGSETRILVNRGFVPLSMTKTGQPAQYQKNSHADFIGLIKESNARSFLEPSDPETSLQVWHNEFIRIDINHLKQQYPYPLAPFYLERMLSLDNNKIKEAIVHTDSEKEELLLLPMRAVHEINRAQSVQPESYPVPFFTTLLPPGRHLGYVFEWLAMAVMTLLICLVLQLRPNRGARLKSVQPASS